MLLKIDDDSPQLSGEKLEIFHTISIKDMFLVKRARPDLDPGFVLLATWVRALTKQCWSKLAKIMSFMLETKDEVLMLSPDDTKNLHWHAGSAFGALPDVKTHTGGTFSMDFGSA